MGHIGYFRNAPSSVFSHYSAPFWDREGPPVLTAIAGNPHVKEITGDKGRVRSLFFDGLVEMFPGVDLESELVGLEVADWASDRWTMGAQSSVPVGCYQMRADLAAPTPPLFWAGEAAHAQVHAACVHGALETGRRAAFEALAASGRILKRHKAEMRRHCGSKTPKNRLPGPAGCGFCIVNNIVSCTYTIFFKNRAGSAPGCLRR